MRNILERQQGSGGLEPTKVTVLAVRCVGFAAVCVASRQAWAKWLHRHTLGSWSARYGSGRRGTGVFIVRGRFLPVGRPSVLFEAKGNLFVPAGEEGSALCHYRMELRS